MAMCNASKPRKSMDEEVQYGAPDIAAAADLRAMARQCFSDTFSHLYDREPFEQFLNAVYADNGSMSKDLLDPSIKWRIAKVCGQVIGYAKLRPLVAPAPGPQKGAVELQQIYVSREWHGRGVAERLMEWALTRARKIGSSEIYLTVFDHNERAKRFYKRHGFVEVGRCTFQLGSRIDDDRIWRKMLSKCPLPDGSTQGGTGEVVVGEDLRSEKEEPVKHSQG